MIPSEILSKLTIVYDDLPSSLECVPWRQIAENLSENKARVNGVWKPEDNRPNDYDKKAYLNALISYAAVALREADRMIVCSGKIADNTMKGQGW